MTASAAAGRAKAVSPLVSSDSSASRTTVARKPSRAVAGTVVDAWSDKDSPRVRKGHQIVDWRQVLTLRAGPDGRDPAGGLSRGRPGSGADPEGVAQCLAGLYLTVVLAQDAAA